MSNDMSMFKKMKERITDEVSSATSKFQNMQLIDQLASSIGQQIKNEMTPNHLLPEPNNLPNDRNKMPHGQFSLIDDGPIGGYNEEEELNSEVSPQHQLFDEHSIKRIQSSSSFKGLDGNGISSSNNFRSGLHEKTDNNFDSVVNVYELSSDLEDDLDVASNGDTKEDDVEIDLLTDKSIDHCGESPVDDKIRTNHLAIFKTKYRNVVHDIRKMHQKFDSQNSKYELEKQQLTNQITALRMELDNTKHLHQNANQSDSIMSGSTLSSDTDKTSSSPQPISKSNSKLKDLEKLLAKCKESLKLKNAQIKTLKDSLGEVEKFRDYNNELKKELAELREAHETWTVSIAENKRVMHQEIENKNSEMEKLRSDINELQNRLSESHNNLRQARSAIQDLESRLVRTSVAHQKERESLAKELNGEKLIALKQQQKESEHQLERVKLDFERSIEALKMELLTKDEQIIKTAEQQKLIQEENLTLTAKLEQVTMELDDRAKRNEMLIKDLDSVKKEVASQNERFTVLKTNIEESDDLKRQNVDLSNHVTSLEAKLKAAMNAQKESEDRLKDAATTNIQECDTCEYLHSHSRRQADKFQQEVHELNRQLDMFNTAHEDQEKEINSLKSERNTLTENYKFLRSEFDELYKKNESLARVMRENETDMQSQQEQLDNLSKVEQELKSVKEINHALVEELNQIKSELHDKNSDFITLSKRNEDLGEQLSTLKTDLKNTQKSLEELKKEKDLLRIENISIVKQQRAQEEQLVVKILSAIKNLETPNTSPGSDKSYDSFQNQAQDSSEESTRELPNPIVLMEELASLALDRCNSYMTTSQRLQAVLLENTMISEELKRIREELNLLNRESSLVNQCSLDEVEKLRTENQALIHDQQAYDDRIGSLEEEVENLNKKLADMDSGPDIVPDSTQFEYLKNIVYQFMLGREPLVLARVISAVFKFDKSQVDQICRVQESIQSNLKPSN